MDIIWGDHLENGLVLGLFLCMLGVFFKVNVQNENGDIFWALLKFQIFFGVCLIFQIFILQTVDAECRPMFKEKKRVPPPPPPPVVHPRSIPEYGEPCLSLPCLSIMLKKIKRKA